MFSREVFKTWALVLQLGISMLVPIFLLVALGHFLNTKFNINLMLLFVIIGVVVGVRNVYVILMNYLKTMPKSKESELLKRHMKQFDKE